MKPIRILMIEDNPGDARLIEEMLKDVEDFDFEVLHALRLDDGLKYLVTNEFDLILLDLCLPDSKGIDTFDIMKYNATDLPIIVLTGMEDEVIAVSAVRKGAEDYLIKGEVDSHQLSRSIKNSLKHQDITV